jgi:carboxy-terminal domain RNA polymerase II polypeptide A small phosphatase
MLVIFDLDETLIHAHTDTCRPCDFVSGPYRCQIRPFARALIESVLSQFDAAVWTSAGDLHARAVVEALFGTDSALRFVWSAERCTHHRDLEDGQLVSLKKLHLNRVVAIDDSPEKHSRNYGNLVRVNPWQGEEDDTELRELPSYLAWLARHSSVRTVEKRGWLHQARWREEMREEAT